MRKIIQITIILLLTGAAITSAKNNTYKITYKREISLSFQVNNQATLELANKYGNIHLYNWDKNQIKADITITVKAQDKEKARQIAEAITVQKDQRGNRVSLVTHYEPSSSSSFWSLLFGGSSGGGGKNVSIDYKVYLPRSLGRLNLTNKYGNITGNAVPGVVQIDLRYGHFRLDNLQKPLSFKVKYGAGSLTHLPDAVIDAAYTDFSIDRVKHLKMHYKYSDLTFGKVGHLRLDGSYGDISAESISTLESHTSYGDYKIQNLIKSAAITTAYGDVRINRTGKLQGLHISARYSDVSLGIAEKQPVQVNIQLHYGDFHSDGLPLQEVQKKESGSSMTFRAHSPGADSHAARISIDGSYSDVKFTVK